MLSRTPTSGRNVEVPSSWKLLTSMTVARGAPSWLWIRSDKRRAQLVPMLPTQSTSHPSCRSMWSIKDVVVVLPFAPVTATTGSWCPRARWARDAYSISLKTSHPRSRHVFTTGALSGMPGLLTTAATSGQASTWCPPVSWSMPARSSSTAPCPAPASLTNARAPRDFASKAEPTPLSPAPSTRMGSVGFMSADF